MTPSLIPGAEPPAAPPETVRRLWIARRAAISAAAVDLLLERALGELPDHLIDWPVPSWAGVTMEAAHA